MINWHQTRLEGQSQQEHDRKKKKALFLCLVLWSVSPALTQRGFTTGRDMDVFPCDTLTGSLVQYLVGKNARLYAAEWTRTNTHTHTRHTKKEARRLI